MAPNLFALMLVGWVQRMLSEGALVLVDGLDEVPVVKRNDCLAWLEGLGSRLIRATIQAQP